MTPNSAACEAVWSARADRVSALIDEASEIAATLAPPSAASNGAKAAPSPQPRLSGVKRPLSALSTSPDDDDDDDDGPNGTGRVALQRFHAMLARCSSRCVAAKSKAIRHEVAAARSALDAQQAALSADPLPSHAAAAVGEYKEIKAQIDRLDEVRVQKSDGKGRW